MKDLELAMKAIREYGADRFSIDDLITASISIPPKDFDWNKYNQMLTDIFGLDYRN